MKKLLLILCAVAFTFSLCLIPFANSFAKGTSDKAYPIAKNQKELNEFNSKSAYLVDFDTKKVLYERNATDRHQIASMVKIMTLNLVFDEIDKGELSLDESVIITPNASGMGGSQMFLDSGLEYKVFDLIKGVIVSSANDASVALAEKIAGTTESFVDLMNAKAREYGMSDTAFVNVTGLPEDGQYSTAKDATTMMLNLLNHPKYYEFSTIFHENFTHPDGRTTDLTNTNKLIKFYSGCDGGKTGFTSKAMYCLSATAKRKDMRVVATVLGAPTSQERNKEVSSLFNYAFSNYSSEKIVQKGSIIKSNVNIKRAKSNDLKLSPKEDYSVLMKKGESAEYNVSIKLNDNLKAPIKSGEIVGKIIVLKADEDAPVKEIDLISVDNVEKATFFEEVKKIFSKWFL